MRSIIVSGRRTNGRGKKFGPNVRVAGRIMWLVPDGKVDSLPTWHWSGDIQISLAEP